MVYLAPPRIHHCLERIRWRRLNGIFLQKKRRMWRRRTRIMHCLKMKRQSKRDRILVGDTDVGRELREQVADLERLLAAYRSGEIIEKV